MNLDLIVESLEGIEEVYHGLYTQDEDGKFRLGVVGIEDTTGLKSALEKEREAKKQADKERKELEAKLKEFSGLDPKTAREALNKLHNSEEQKLLDEGKLDEVLNKRTENMRADHANQVSKLTQVQEELQHENAKLKEQLSRAVVEQSIVDSVMQVGAPRKEAMPDIISRGKREWSLSEDGHPVCKNPDGSVVYGKDGKAPITPIEWAQNLIEKAPHLWSESKGGGSTGSRAGDSRMISAAALDKMSPAEKMKAGRNLQMQSNM